MILDLSSNGNFADEASLLVAIGTVIGIFVGGSKISKRVRRIDHAVNNVDVPIDCDATATLGQRIVRLESNLDEQAKSLRSLSEAWHELVRMANHRHERIEEKIDKIGEVIHVRQVAP